MTDHPEQTATEPQAPVSRRGMLRYGALAAAAAAGAAGAAAGASPAQAAPGEALTVDGANVGAATTKLTGSNLAVTANSPRPAVVATNSVGPQLQLSVNQALEFPPKDGTYEVGAIINWRSQLYQCIESAGPNGRTLWRGLSNLSPVLTLFPQPVRVYASSGDARYANAKIANSQVRQIDVTRIPGGAAASGVPEWAVAVTGTIQLSATETTSGWLSVAGGDVAKPAGFSTVVWSSAGLASVTAFTSALSDPNGDNKGTLSIACYGSATTKTHFFVDVVGYYDYDLYAGGMGANGLQLEAVRGVATQAKQVRK